MVPLLMLVGIVLLFITRAISQTDNCNYHQIFPAARYEQYTFGNDFLLRTLDRNHFTIQFHAPEENDLVKEFVEKARQRYMGFWFMGIPSANENPPNNIAPDNNATTTLEALERLDVYVSTNNVELKQGMDESYTLTIPQVGNAVLESKSVFGMLRGFESFGQLVKYGWNSDNDGNHDDVFVISFTPLAIKDKPEYPHRGLMIDAARHFLPLELILDTTLDAMAMNKMNVLHWHMTDDQSFPFRSSNFPELADKGSFSPSLVYTPNDVRRVVQEAYFRGIRVIPEFDMPGHTQAIAMSHPELMSRCPQPSTPLNPTSPKVYGFISRLYDEIVELFPDSIVHLGGDEVDFHCWEYDPTIQSWMQQHNMTNETQLYEYFEQEFLKIVASKKKSVIVWQEVFDLGLLSNSNGAIVDVWKGYNVDTIQRATSSSFQVLISGCWYLDHLDKRYLDFHQCLPRNFTAASLRQKQLVIGGHASMWGERVDASNFVSRVWPRASAAAERLWSGDHIVGDDNNSTLVLDRVAKFRCQMLARNISASPVGPGFCNFGPKSINNNGNQRVGDSSLFEATNKI